MLPHTLKHCFTRGNDTEISPGNFRHAKPLET